MWLAWSSGYKSFRHRCEQLLAALGGYRSWGDAVRLDWHSPEHLGLIRFAPGDLYTGPFSERCARPPGC